MTKLYQETIDKLKAHGLNDQIDVYEFWTKNKQKLIPLLYGHNVHNNIFTEHVRWFSPIGEYCQEMVKEYIIRESVSATTAMFQQLKAGKATEENAIIDFRGFTFEFEYKSYNLETFAQLFDTDRIFGAADLRGIDLSEIRITGSCIFINCDFNGASFDNSYINYSRFINCTLANSTFRDAHINALGLEGNSYINGMDISGSYIYIQGLNDNSFNFPIIFREISFWRLLKITIKKVFNSRSPIDRRKEKYTRFQHWNLTDVNSINIREQKSYIDWYQRTLIRLAGLEKATIEEKIMFLLTVLSTKHWYSIKVFSIFSFFLNLGFSTVIYFSRCHFEKLCKDDSFFSSLYYSTVTFTTLGYGDIYPITHWGQTIVILEVVSGYIVLGLFLFLLSKKINQE